MPFAAKWMQLQIIILWEVNQKRKTKTLYDITVIWNLKYGTNEPTYKTETVHRHKEHARHCQGWAGWWQARQMNWELEVGKFKLLYLEWINNKILMHSTGNYTEYPVVNHNGK